MTMQAPDDPHDNPLLPPPADSTSDQELSLTTTIDQLPRWRQRILAGATLADAAAMLAEHRQAPGLLIARPGGSESVLPRLEAIERLQTQPELADKPLTDALADLIDRPLVLPGDCPLPEAAVQAARRPGRTCCYPILVHQASGESWLLDTAVLFQAQSSLLNEARRLVDRNQRELSRHRHRLEQMEKKYHLLTERASEGICIIQGDRIRWANPSFAELVGVVREQLLDSSLDEIVHPDDREIVHRRLMELESGYSRPSMLTLRLLREGGGYRWVRISENGLDWQGQPARLAFITDIHELTETENALRRSEQQKAILLDNLSEIVTYQNPDLRLQWVNRATCEALGRPMDEIIGRKCHEVWQNSDRPCVDCPVMRAFETGLPQFGEVSTVDGRSWYVGSIPIISERGMVTGVVETALDITERKRNERALRVRERQLRLFVAHTPTAVAMFDRDMNYLVASDQWLRMHRLQGREYVGRSHLELFPEAPEHWRQAYRKALDGDPQYCDEEEIVGPEGTPEWVRWEIHPWQESTGRIGGIIKFTEVITDRKWAEDALRRAKTEAERASHMKSAFLANVSHEIRTPLNGVIGFAESILSAPSVEDSRELARTILRESEHLLQLINTLLDHAKIEAGKLELEYIPLALEELLESVVSSTHAHAHKKDLQLFTQISENVPPFIHGDPLRLRQILLNLVNNAIKFTDSGSISVHIDTVESGDGWATLRFAVTDTGIGVPADKQESIFDSFAQADGSTSRKYGGTGLGTAICKQIVDIMGGEMGLDSAPGKGSTFWFTLDTDLCDDIDELDEPAVDAQQQADQLIARFDRKVHVLVAEDYPTNQKVVRMHLEQAGHSVVIAENGRQAVDACRGELFDMVFMDVQMPEMDGLSAVEAIRRELPDYADVPIVALTANGEIDTRLACLQSGMNDVVIKPIRRDALLAAMASWLMARDADGPEPPVPQPTSAEPACAEEPTVDPPPNPIDQADGAAPIDLDEATREFGGDREMVEMVVGGFLDDAKGQVVSLREAVRNGDTETLRREAHKIKGGAANLTAYPLAAAARELEELAKTGRVAEAQTSLDQLEYRFDELWNLFRDPSNPT